MAPGPHLSGSLFYNTAIFLSINLLGNKLSRGNEPSRELGFTSKTKDLNKYHSKGVLLKHRKSISLMVILRTPIATIHWTKILCALPGVFVSCSIRLLQSLLTFWLFELDTSVPHQHFKWKDIKGKTSSQTIPVWECQATPLTFGQSWGVFVLYLCSISLRALMGIIFKKD